MYLLTRTSLKKISGHAMITVPSIFFFLGTDDIQNFTFLLYKAMNLIKQYILLLLFEMMNKEVSSVRVSWSSRRRGWPFYTNKMDNLPYLTSPSPVPWGSFSIQQFFWVKIVVPWKTLILRPSSLSFQIIDFFLLVSLWWWKLKRRAYRVYGAYHYIIVSN